MEKKAYLTIRYLSFLVVWITIAGCEGRKPIDESRFDRERWQTDKMGCEGERQEMLQDFEAIKEDLVGMSVNEVRKVLGKPDKVELYRRSQRFYIYFYEKGAQCEEIESGGEGKNFYVRFNTLDQVSEISLHLPSEE